MSKYRSGSFGAGLNSRDSKMLPGKHNIRSFGFNSTKDISEKSEKHWQKLFKEFMKLKNPKKIEELESSLTMFFVQQIQNLPEDQDNTFRAQQIIKISRAHPWRLCVTSKNYKVIVKEQVFHKVK